MSVIIVLILLLSIYLFEYFSIKKLLPKEISRKFLHIIAGTVALVAINLINDYSFLIAAGLIASLSTFYAIKKNLISGIEIQHRKSWGIFYFCLSFTLLIIFWFEKNYWIINVAFALMVYADSLAAIVGTISGKKSYRLSSDPKTYLGSFVFFIVSIIILAIFAKNLSYQLFFTFDAITILLIISVAFTLTIVEAISSKGFDNFSVPIIASILIYFLFFIGSEELIIYFIIAVGLGIAISLISLKFKFLKKSGAAATFLLATFVFGFGGFKWTIPILTFFVLSSLISKIRKKNNSTAIDHFEKSSERDYLQVLANGGIIGLLVVVDQFYPNQIFFYLAVTYVAAACSDTWSTEIGTLRNFKTYNILTFKKIEQGVSGGVSLMGSMGGLLGAIVIAAVSIFWINDTNILYLIVIAALFGNFSDSIIGATIQVKYKCKVCKKITEKRRHCDSETLYNNGVKFVNNDLVNILGGISSMLFFNFIKLLF